MLTLGIETSCDETSAALVEDGRRILSNVVSSQVEVHAGFGGVVPELAARAHIERLPRVLDLALERGGRSLQDVELIAVTRGPGLIGSLLVGVGFARGLALERGLPLVGVSHLEGHIHSAFLESAETRAPLLVLIASGGHTELVLQGQDGSCRVLGRTLDDAVGEAFDKVARLLGLSYPGGPEIERLAAKIPYFDASRDFPLPKLTSGGLDFSFSGIKTAVRYLLARQLRLPPQMPTDGSVEVPPDIALAAAGSFQGEVVRYLVDRLVAATDETRPATVALAGGVARNRALRQAAAEAMSERGVALVIPLAELCTDNGAMIAAAGYHLWQQGGGADLEVDPALKLAG